MEFAPRTSAVVDDRQRDNAELAIRAVLTLRGSVAKLGCAFPQVTIAKEAVSYGRKNESLHRSPAAGANHEASAFAPHRRAYTRDRADWQGMDERLDAARSFHWRDARAACDRARAGEVVDGCGQPEDRIQQRTGCGVPYRLRSQ